MNLRPSLGKLLLLGLLLLLYTHASWAIIPSLTSNLRIVSQVDVHTLSLEWICDCVWQLSGRKIRWMSASSVHPPPEPPKPLVCPQIA